MCFKCYCSEDVPKYFQLFPEWKDEESMGREEGEVRRKGNWETVMARQGKNLWTMVAAGFRPCFSEDKSAWQERNVLVNVS